MIDAAPAATSHNRMAEPTPTITVPLPTLLHRLIQAFAAGDAPLGEQLLLQALDQQLPWDVVCAAAARGIAARRDEQSRA